MAPTPKITLTVRIVPEIREALARLSAERGESLNATVEAILAKATRGK